MSTPTLPPTLTTLLATLSHLHTHLTFTTTTDLPLLRAFLTCIPLPPTLCPPTPTRRSPLFTQQSRLAVLSALHTRTLPHLLQTRPAAAYNFAQRSIEHTRALLRAFMSALVDAEFSVAELRAGVAAPEVLVGVEEGIDAALMLYGAAVVELDYVRRRWPCEYLEPEEPGMELELLLERGGVSRRR
ncbi:uncharacterized protein H6S33_003262 [Morchella sextelata]|uniref:uncharacterized protein n=1 Tax=Morchella sextelata TaxID=1174677 RepID=UPI001D04806D|nr:uncharacterized protein H6S33_003262 [Morchella sextelata]KAH0607274.1 hypothetical protein H6S33_003262 [Morchella sextelata]